ncbi:hypothetical protein EDB83DRAFT_2309595 [Lactarius deliciosus]|nr:hypothetical protein EDB83DRAFT_2309595 [Lactarius deliciosus]
MVIIAIIGDIVFDHVVVWVRVVCGIVVIVSHAPHIGGMQWWRDRQDLMKSASGDGISCSSVLEDAGGENGNAGEWVWQKLCHPHLNMGPVLVQMVASCLAVSLPHNLHNGTFHNHTQTSSLA